MPTAHPTTAALTLVHRLAAALTLTLTLALGASTALAQDVRPEQPAGTFSVLHREGKPSLLVVRARTEPSWGRGGLRLLERAWPTEVDRAVRRRALPADVRADLRRTIVLSNHERAVCTARLGRPRLLRHLSPDFHYSAWNGEEDTPRLPDSEVARLAWDMGGNTELLVARIIPVRDRCRDAEWGSRQAPDFGADLGADAAAVDEAAVVAAFRARPQYRELAEAWIDARVYDEDPTAERWDEREGGVFRSISTATYDGTTYSLIHATAHDLCGDFTGTLWVLFEHDGDALIPVFEDRVFGYAPAALIDLDRDGVPEVLARHHLTWIPGGAAVDVSAPFLGCPC